MKVLVLFIRRTFHPTTSGYRKLIDVVRKRVWFKTIKS